jgi:hypothetical protein
MAEGSIRGIVCNGISDGNRPGQAAGANSHVSSILTNVSR